MALFLFGAVLSKVLGMASLGPAILLAFLVIFVFRPSVIGLVLARAKMSWEAHAFVAWFGPRGLNSLLLMLLVVHAGVPGGELLFSTVGVVVLASVALHGASATPSASGTAVEQQRLRRPWQKRGRALQLGCLSTTKETCPALSRRTSIHFSVNCPRPLSWTYAHGRAMTMMVPRSLGAYAYYQTTSPLGLLTNPEIASLSLTVPETMKLPAPVRRSNCEYLASVPRLWKVGSTRGAHSIPLNPYHWPSLDEIVALSTL